MSFAQYYGSARSERYEGSDDDMADSMQNLDLNFPELTDGKSTEEKLVEIRDYLFILLENLRFLLHNLGLENFNSAELDALTAPVYKSISDLEGNLTELALTAEGLGLRVANAEEDITTVAITAQGASITAQNAAGQAAAVALTVDGFTVYDPNTGRKTNISGDYIRSGTIKGVTLASSDYNGGAVVIEDGGIKFYLNPEDFFWLGSLGRNVDGQFELSNLSSYNPLKIKGVGNMSIDVTENNTMYIGTSNANEKVTIGNGSTEIRLVGNVYINGVLQTKEG